MKGAATELKGVRGSERVGWVRVLARAPDTAPALWEVEALSLFLSPRHFFFF